MILSKALNMFINHLKKRGSSEKTQKKYYKWKNFYFLKQNLRKLEQYHNKRNWKIFQKTKMEAQYKMHRNCTAQELFKILQYSRNLFFRFKKSFLSKKRICWSKFSKTERN